MITKEELIEWAKRHGFSNDRFGHYQRETGIGSIYRLKLSNISARYEKKIALSNKNEWIKLASGYYKNLSIMPDDKLSGLK